VTGSLSNRRASGGYRAQVTSRRASLSAVCLTVLAVGLMLVMIMFAARSGPERIFAGPLHDPSFRPVDPSYSLSLPPGAGTPRLRDVHTHSNPILAALGWAIRVAALLCVMWLLYRAARKLLEHLKDRQARNKPKGPAHVDFDVLDDPDPLIEEIRQGADDQFALLLGGHPRNAIVACWDRFEEQAERVHASRRPWETSSEFTLRLLDAVSADAAAVSRLEALYREARFSAHEIDEGRRQAALEALRAIHASLGLAAPVG
jgi:Domain of unknown function (DUF4129)